MNIPHIKSWGVRSPAYPRFRRKSEADISIRSKVIRGSQNFEIWSRDPGHAHLGVVLWSGRSMESVIYVCAILEADISIGSKVIRGSKNLQIWSRDSGHAHFGVFLWSTRRMGPSSMTVPNLKRIALFVQKLLGRGPKISILGHVTLSYAPFEP